MVRTAVTYGTFPLVLGGATAAGWALLARWPPEVVVAALGLVCVLVVALLERVHPYLPSYNRSHGDIPTDVAHNLVSGIAIPEATRLLTFGAVYALGAHLAGTMGLSPWPHAWPLLAQLALALLVAELPSYWLHRAQHTWSLWWRLHATHHAVPRLYWLNAGRFHPLDALLSYATLMFPLVLLGVPEQTLALFTVFITAHGLLQHSNIGLGHGVLNWIFSTAELHRWHHAPEPADANHNYGAVLIVWDLLFGTRYLPADRKAPQHIGIASMPDFPTGYVGQLVSPFRWPPESAS